MPRRRTYHALSDVLAKSPAQVERETATKWAARAVDCFRQYHKTGAVRWLLRAEDMKHEAIEHAASVGDHGKTAGKIQRMIERAVHKIEYSPKSTGRHRRKSR